MGIFLAVLAFFSKVLDLLNPWSAYWVNKRKGKDAKQEEARKNMDDSAKKKGDYDAFLDGLNDSNNP